MNRSRHEELESGRPVRIYSVDDHPIVQEGLRALIESQPEFTLVGQASTGREALLELRSAEPAVLLIDLRLPDISGLELLSQIKSGGIQLHAIVLTTYLADVQVARAFEAGASGFLLKSALRRDLVRSIHTVMAGNRVLAPEVAMEVAKHTGEETLTSREVDVLRELATGSSNKTAGKRLGVSGETVKGHVARILEKLHAKDRTHAVAIGYKRGFLDL